MCLLCNLLTMSGRDEGNSKKSNVYAKLDI